MLHSEFTVTCQSIAIGTKHQQHSHDDEKFINNHMRV